MKKLLFIPLLFLSIVGYSQMNTFGGIGLRVNDTTTYQTNAAAYHTAGYYDIYFNNQATNDHFDVWNGSSYDHIFSFSTGGNFWKGAGTTTLTAPVLITSADSIGIASTDQINIRTSADNFTGISNGDYTQGNIIDHAFVGVYKDGTNGHNVYQIAADGGDIHYTSLQVWPGGASAYTIDADTLVFDVDQATKFKINPGGDWLFSGGTDPGTAGDVLQSNGSGAAPTWVAPSGGGGATAAGATGNIQYKSNGGGLQAEAALTYDSATNILTIPNAKITGGTPGAGKLLQSDADGDASWVSANPIGSQDLFISAAAMWPRATDGSSFLTRLETGTSLFNIQSLDFDQTTQEFAQLQLVLPRNWNNGTITAVVYWTAASGSGTVQWGISGGAYSNDDALSVAFGTPQTTDDTLITTGDLHITPVTSAITLAGTPADADFLGIQISRNPASDTLSGDAKLLGIRFTLTLDAAVSE